MGRKSRHPMRSGKGYARNDREATLAFWINRRIFGSSLFFEAKPRQAFLGQSHRRAFLRQSHVTAAIRVAGKVSAERLVLAVWQAVRSIQP